MKPVLFVKEGCYECQELKDDLVTAKRVSAANVVQVDDVDGLASAAMFDAAQGPFPSLVVFGAEPNEWRVVSEVAEIREQLFGTDE